MGGSSGSALGGDRRDAGEDRGVRADAGLEDWVRDLAAREKACCAFFGFEITHIDDEVIWDVAVIDTDAARAVLDEFYALTENASESVEGLRARFTGKGLTFVNSTGM